MANEPKDPNSDPSAKLEAEIQKTRLRSLAAITEALKEQEEASQRLIELAQKGGEEEENHLQTTERLIENEKQRVKSLEKELELKKELGFITDEEYEQEKKNLEVLKQQNKEYEKKNKAEKDFANSLTNSFTSMTGIGGQSKTVLGNMVQMAGKGGSLTESLSAAAKNMSQMITIGNVLAAAVDGIVGQTKKLFFDMDKAFSQFEKTAGGVDAFKGRIEDLRRSNVEYALSIEEASKAYSDLKVNFAGFAGVSKTNQDQLAATTAQMDKLGVSSGETIKIQNMLVKGFQMSGEQAGNLQKQLMATAKAMGLPMQKVVGDFANASAGMKAHGSNMQKVFLDLQNQSKNLGIEFTKLQQITGKFDTFEGAADSAGQLNAILGGDYLNSLDLVNADEAERVRLMQEALKASGKSFEAMSKQERMAAAQALGLENATELQQFMNNEVEQGTVEALNKAEAEKELAKSVQDVTTMQDKLTAIMAQFAIVMTPVLDKIKEFLTGLGKLMSENPKAAQTIAYLTLAAGGLYTAFVTLRGAYEGFQAFKSFREGMAAAGGGITGFLKQLWAKITATKVATKANEELGKSEKEVAKSGDGGENLSKTIEKVGQAAKNSWREILAFGAAVLMIGGGIAIAALGLAELVKAFQGLTGEQVLGALGALIIVMGGFALMLYILTGAAIPAALPMLALGAAFLLIGAGIAIAALGMSVLVKSFAGLGDSALPAALAVGLLAGAMVLITYALVGAIPATVAAGVAFAAAAPGILAFGGAVALIGVGVGIAAAGIGFLAKSVGDMFEKISKSNPDSVSGAFSALFDNLTLTNIGKFTTFASKADDLTESLNELADSLSTVATNMKLIASLNNIFASFNIPSPATATPPPTASTVSAVPAAVTAANTTVNSAANNANNSGQTNLVPVAIYIDSKKIGEILDPRVKQTIQDSLKNINGRIVPITS